MYLINSSIKKLALRFGIEIKRVSSQTGYDPFADMRRFMKGNSSPLVFDVGANRGQSIVNVKKYFPNAHIHAFEPGPTTFLELKNLTATSRNLTLANVALGSKSGTLEFIENTDSDMSSFLAPGKSCWGSIKKKTLVPVTTLDGYCSQQNIQQIDILKIDTQGYDLEVLRGANEMLKSGKIRFIFTEIILSDMYENIPRFDELYGFLLDNGYKLVSFYYPHYQNDHVSWMDGLFVSS